MVLDMISFIVMELRLELDTFLFGYLLEVVDVVCHDERMEQ